MGTSSPEHPPAVGSPARPPDTGEKLLVAALVVAGLVLRLVGLGTFPFEQDEFYSVIESRDLFATRLQPGIDARPLYYLLQHLLLGLFPQTPAWLRAPALCFGLAGLLGLWWLGRRVYGKVGGLAALAFGVVSPWHMYVSGMMRYGSLIFLLSAAAAGVLFSLPESASGRRWAAPLLLLVAGTLVHPAFVFPIAGVAFGLCWWRPGGRWRWTWPWQGAFRAVWLGFAAFLLLEFLLLKLTGRSGAVRNFSGRGITATLRLLPAITFAATPGLLTLGVMGMIGSLRGTDRVRRWGVMALGGLASTGLGLLLASTRTDVYYDYAMGSLPLIIVSAGGVVAMAAEAAGSRQRWLVACLIAAVIAGMLPSTVSHLMEGSRFDYRPAIAEVRRLGPGDPLVMSPEIVPRSLAPELQVVGLRAGAAYLDSVATRHPRFWLVVSRHRHGIALGDDGTLEDWLLQRCRLVRRWDPLRLDYPRHAVELFQCTR